MRPVLIDTASLILTLLQLNFWPLDGNLTNWVVLPLIFHFLFGVCLFRDTSHATLAKHVIPNPENIIVLQYYDFEHVRNEHFSIQ